MSQVENKISYDPRICVSEYPAQFTEVGPTQVTPKVIPATATSNSNLQWMGVISPGKCLLGRCFILEYTVVVIASPATAVLAGYSTSNIGTAGIVTGAYDGIMNNAGASIVNTVFRSNPLMRVCTSMSLSINGTDITFNPQQVLQCTGPYIYTKEQRKRLASMFPAMLDKAPFFGSDAVQTANNGSSNSQSYFCNSDGTTRACYFPTKVQYSNTASPPGTVTYTYQVFEPVLISPLSSYYYNDVAFGNVEVFNLNLLLDASNGLNNMFVSSTSVANAGISSVAIVEGSAKLHVEYLSVDPMVNIIPDVCVYNYETANNIPKKQTITVADSQYFSDAIKLGAQPKLIYVSLNPPIAGRASNILDCGAFITKLQVMWGTKGSSFLSNLGPMDLWRMTMKNTGSDLSYNEWRLGGYAVCFNPCTDFGATLSELSGEAGSSLMFNITVNAELSNYRQTIGLTALNTFLTTVGDEWNLNITYVQQGNIMIGSDNTCKVNIQVVTPSEVLVALNDGGISSEALPQGGSLFGSTKNIFHKAVKHGASALRSDAGQNALKYLSGGSMTAGGMGGTGGYIDQNFKKGRKQRA